MRGSERTLIRATSSSFKRDGQLSLSRGPALVLSKGMPPSTFFVAASTMTQADKDPQQGTRRHRGQQLRQSVNRSRCQLRRRRCSRSSSPLLTACSAHGQSRSHVAFTREVLR